MTSRRRFLAATAALATLAPNALSAKGISFADVLKDAEAARMGPVDHFRMGRAAAAGLVEGRTLLPANAAAAVYARQVLDTLMLASRHPYAYRGAVFGVIATGDVNAYAAPGPFIFVTTGMLRFLRDEEELAAILGHELAHAELQHAVYEHQNAQARKTFDKATDGGFRDTLQKMQSSISQGYSVEIEAEADARAVELAAACGYRPNALVDVLERFKAYTNSYGGGRYPIQRAGMVAQGAARQPQPEAGAIAVRAERFRKAVAALPKSA